MPLNADVLIHSHGSLWSFRPLSVDAESWMDENLPDDAPRLGDAVMVETRFVEDIMRGMHEDGLVLRGPEGV